MTHMHPISGLQLSGILLFAGAVLRETDFYDSTNGEWQTCPTPKAVLRRGCATIWVRPFDPSTLDPKARDLLCYLAGLEGPFVWVEPTTFGPWVAVSSATLRPDPRLMHPTVKHPECLAELERIGFVQRHTNRYALTDTGFAAGKQFCNEHN